jgi:hypothetical protein
LPDPDGPRMTTARPSVATVLACTVSAEMRGADEGVTGFMRDLPPASGW